MKRHVTIQKNKEYSATKHGVSYCGTKFSSTQRLQEVCPTNKTFSYGKHPKRFAGTQLEVATCTTILKTFSYGFKL